jgi:hypothetical protein
MRFSPYLLSFCLAATASVAFAQEDPETPRNMVVEQLRPPQQIETDIDAPVELIELFEETAIELEEQEQAEPATEEIELTSETSWNTKEDSRKVNLLAPFYLSANDYHELRGAKKTPQWTLEYEVTTAKFGASSLGDPQTRTLLVGTDYVSMRVDDIQKIYDFKLNRYLEIKPNLGLDGKNTDGLIFDNISLFAKAFRNLSIVNKSTDAGKKRIISVSEDKDLDSFWLESAMSWAAAPLKTPLEVDQRDALLFAARDGNGIFKANFDAKNVDENFKTDGFKDAFLAFAHHEWPLHPSILKALYAYDTPPSDLNMVSFGPKAPDGEKQTWSLVKATFGDAAFPLPQNAKSAVEREPVSPLAFVINEAVHNRAVGGIQSPEQIHTEFKKAQKVDDKLAQWILGQKYNAYSGRCDQSNGDSLCDALQSIINENRFNLLGQLDKRAKKLSDYSSAFEMAKDKKSRPTALLTLKPYLTDPEIPAIVLRTAAMTRASMKTKSAQTAGLGSINAAALLKRSLATDPYDPYTYIGLAQIYAAKGAYEQSWDMYDTLRAGIPTALPADLPIDDVEETLKLSAAGYFLNR